MTFINPFVEQGKGAPISFGPELVTDSRLTSASTLVVQSGGGTVTKRTDTPPSGFNSYLRCQAGDTSYERIELASNITIFETDSIYLIQALVRDGSVSGDDQGFSTDPLSSSRVLGYQYIDPNISDWQWLIGIASPTATTATPRIYINRGAGSASDVVDIAYLSIKKLGV